VRTEIAEVLSKHNHEVTYDGLQEMCYLDMVISGAFSSSAYFFSLITTDTGRVRCLPSGCNSVR
jgi:hypothetical protein